MFGTSSTITGSLVKLTRFSLCQLNVLTTRQLIHCNAALNVRFRDIVPATTTSPAGSQDILLQNIRSAKDSSDVLNSINCHHAIMNSQHALQALKILFHLQKAESLRTSNGEVINSKDFRKLCEVLKSQIRHIELNDLVEVLKCLGYLGVSADSKIVSIILGLISKQVNDLSLQQITFLDFIMKDFKGTPLVKALRIAMPIVFEANLEKKCDFDNIPQLCDLFYFVCKRKNMENSANMLIGALIDRRALLNLKDAKTIVHALCDSRYFGENYHLLLCHTLDVITDSLDNMDYYEVESILFKLTVKHADTYGNPSFYHEEFCNGVMRQLKERDYSFEQSIWILKKIIKFNHVNLPFLAHLAAKVEREPWLLEQGGAAVIIIFLNGFSMADYKPPNWQCIKPLVIKACEGLVDRPELPWMRLMLDMCVLDCWSEELLQNIFSKEFLSSFMARDYKLDRIQLLTLDQVSATLSPWTLKPRAPPDIISPIMLLNGAHFTSFPLQAALHHGLGGQQYVLTGVSTCYGHFLDHVVVMRKGGYPVAINLTSTNSKERITTDNIQVPPDSKMVAVLLIPSTMCATNNERVRGMFRMNVNSIETLGIVVATVLQPVWNNLPDNERIPYLMRAIQDKLPTTEMTQVITPV